ncbi:hypothetical protein Cni_G17010 [Canna indica]|uniref:RING-type domain-containing protein n=1 Tax=Canna indica TaxID=4628 RepID=A0AAQ3KJX4_9LILI|nr:hypothetical protein Cni_G17010 [Canna indica]
MSNFQMSLRLYTGSIVLLIFVIAGVLYRLVCRTQRRLNLAEPPPVSPHGIGLSSAAANASPRDAGLSQSAIDALPTFAFEGGSTETQCAVCLNVVTEGEMMRLLPYCKHAFHVACIDAWLRSHSLCPLCRAEAKPPSPARSAEKMEV